MSSFRSVVAGVLLAAAAAGAWAQSAPPRYPGIGRTATASEVAAWDVDVRPDFKGLPKGQGSVAAGMQLWEGKCASCHGIFGESNEVFQPIVGGTTKADIETGRVARLTDAGYPGRTTMMKLSTVSTLWDYIRRAMPWTQPKSLSVDETYAVTAYILNLAGVVGDDFVLSDSNIASVQRRLPNRNGMRTDHGMWPGKGIGNGGRPDVRAGACMRDCATETTVASYLPDHARNAHGNLAEQNRAVGAQHGVDTTRPAGATAPAAPAPAPVAPVDADALTLARKHNCLVCHAPDKRLIGPGFAEVARKYAARDDAAAYLAARIASGGTGVWGAVPMPAQTLPPEDARTIAQWLATGARR